MLDPKYQYKLKAERYQAIFEKQKDSAKPSTVLKLAQYWNKAGEPEKSLKACQILQKLLQANSDTKVLATYGEGLAKVYAELNQSESAIKWFNVAIENTETPYQKDRIRNLMENFVKTQPSVSEK